MDFLYTAASAVVGGVTAYLLGKRRESGKVGVSDAQTIFREGAKFRGDLIGRVRELEDTLERERHEQQVERHRLRNELLACKLKLHKYEREARDE
jgi:hypothetical protein